MIRFLTVYDVPATRLAIIGWRAGTHGTHRTCVLVYNPRGSLLWSFGLAAFLQSFSQKYVFHVFCVFSQRKFANVVCSVICSNVSGDRDRGLFHLSFAPLAPPAEQTEHHSSPDDMSDRCRTTRTCSRIKVETKTGLIFFPRQTLRISPARRWHCSNRRKKALGPSVLAQPCRPRNTVRRKSRTPVAMVPFSGGRTP